MKPGIVTPLNHSLVKYCFGKRSCCYHATDLFFSIASYPPAYRKIREYKFRVWFTQSLRDILLAIYRRLYRYRYWWDREFIFHGRNASSNSIPAIPFKPDPSLVSCLHISFTDNTVFWQFNHTLSVCCISWHIITSVTSLSSGESTTLFKSTFLNSSHSVYLNIWGK